uniref:FERM domain-containing protein n=1 Tax=Angiostrongylus cantonensis TaxID=6313 RepID=A0A0K0D381_ANGCA
MVSTCVIFNPTSLQDFVDTGDKAMTTALFDEISSEESNVLFYAHRKATFQCWCFDKEDVLCSSDTVNLGFSAPAVVWN